MYVFLKSAVCMYRHRWWKENFFHSYFCPFKYRVHPQFVSANFEFCNLCLFHDCKNNSLFSLVLSAIQLCKSETGIDNRSLVAEWRSCEGACEERTLYRKAIFRLFKALIKNKRKESGVNNKTSPCFGGKKPQIECVGIFCPKVLSFLDF